MAESTGISDTIERSIFIAADVEKVWDVVSIPGWWINEGSAIDLSIIERLAEDRSVVHHSVFGDISVDRLDADRPRSASFRWVLSSGGGQQGDTPQQEFLDTRVTLTLTPEDSGTRLSVVESGFATAAAADEQFRRRAYEENCEGWDIEMRLVKAYTEGE